MVIPTKAKVCFMTENTFFTPNAELTMSAAKRKRIIRLLSVPDSKTNAMHEYMLATMDAISILKALKGNFKIYPVQSKRPVLIAILTIKSTSMYIAFISITPFMKILTQSLGRNL